MRLTLIYDPECPKLRLDAYSQCYRDMFLALQRRFGDVQHVTKNCSACDIDGDVVIFYDIHSSHHIEIDGIANHKSVKYEYFNDPWQPEFEGKYKDGTPVHKLNPEQRSLRAIKRNIDFIICPYENLYWRFISPYLGERLVWFPIAPDDSRFICPPLSQREPEVLWNGAAWGGQAGFHPYEFRMWAINRDGITKAVHSIANPDTPAGLKYPEFLARYAGALALCDTHICPKYSEIPMAGCVCFAQELYDYKKMGFKDMESCVFVTKGNFDGRISDFKNNIQDYQMIADGGREIMKKYTADKFAEYIYGHADGHKL